MDGQALNITLVNNGDNLDFGLVGCRRSIPHLQRLLGHLEDVAEGSRARGRRVARRDAETQCGTAAVPRAPATAIEVLIAHPGGPFWARKDDGAWSIPKGEYDRRRGSVGRRATRIRRGVGPAGAGRHARRPR